MPYQNSELDKIYLPTPTKIREAMKAADELDENKRDVRPLMSILMRVRSGARIKGNLLTRKMGVASFKWQISANDASNVEKASEATVRLENAIKFVIRHHELTAAYGVSLFGLLWTPLTIGNTPSITKLFLPTEVEKYNESSAAILSDEAKPKRTVITKNETQSYLIDFDDEVERGGILRSLIELEFLRHKTITNWDELNDRLKGIIMGLVNWNELQKTGLSDLEIGEQINSLDKALKEAGKSNYLRALSAVDIQLKNLVEANAANSYKDYISLLATDASIAILGQANTSELPQNGGSRAALQVLNLIRADILLGDMIRVEDLINDQLIKFDALLNYSTEEPPYKFSFIFDDNLDIATYSLIFSNLAQNGNDVPILKNEFYRLQGLSVPQDGEETITLQQSKGLVL